MKVEILISLNMILNKKKYGEQKMTESIKFIN